MEHIRDEGDKVLIRTKKGEEKWITKKFYENAKKGFKHINKSPTATQQRSKAQVIGKARRRFNEIVVAALDSKSLDEFEITNSRDLLVYAMIKKTGENGNYKAINEIAKMEAAYLDAEKEDKRVEITFHFVDGGFTDNDPINAPYFKITEFGEIEVNSE